ncbi:MAG: hypothetical protein P3T54_09000 [Dehalogenimonas sp.]|jgi:hypothetical protein|uniref:Uncharacterized protein n=1 Tax=Candidatus Dehalogenimonas loeffleri TaxID=3127115 RepID=A0ABZ2J289_9CHLR|nr:hypothetical protein [Dehalogenimonas sp.]
MTTARVLIDLQEGVIELEGPVEFVEKHMGRFLLDDAVTAEPLPGRKAGRPAKTATAGRKKKKDTCGEVIDSLYDSGFFKRARGFGVIKQQVLKTAPECSDNLIRKTVKEAVAGGKLTQSGIGRGMKYTRAQ